MSDVLDGSLTPNITVLQMAPTEDAWLAVSVLVAIASRASLNQQSFEQVRLRRAEDEYYDWSKGLRYISSFRGFWEGQGFGVFQLRELPLAELLLRYGYGPDTYALVHGVGRLKLAIVVRPDSSTGSVGPVYMVIIWYEPRDDIITGEAITAWSKAVRDLAEHERNIKRRLWQAAVDIAAEVEDGTFE